MLRYHVLCRCAMPPPPVACTLSHVLPTLVSMSCLASRQRNRERIASSCTHTCCGEAYSQLAVPPRVWLAEREDRNAIPRRLHSMQHTELLADTRYTGPALVRWGQ